MDSFSSGQLNATQGTAHPLLGWNYAVVSQRALSSVGETQTYGCEQERAKGAQQWLYS